MQQLHPPTQTCFDGTYRSGGTYGDAWNLSQSYFGSYLNPIPIIGRHIMTTYQTCFDGTTGPRNISAWNLSQSYFGSYLNPIQTIAGYIMTTIQGSLNQLLNHSTGPGLNTIGSKWNRKKVGHAERKINGGKNCSRRSPASYSMAHKEKGKVVVKLLDQSCRHKVLIYPMLHSMAMGYLNKSKKTTALKVAPQRTIIHKNQNLPFLIKIYLVKVPLNVKIVQQDLLHRKQFLKIV